MSETEFSKVRHDLRGCLNAIQLGVEAIRLTVSPDEEVTQFLGGIASEVAKADRLLQSTVGRDQISR